MKRLVLFLALLSLLTYVNVTPANASSQAGVPAWLKRAFLCIHRYEGAWNANTGNGYYGGLQMDWSFMRTYGGEHLRRWGPAHNWPPHIQIQVAARAYYSGRGFGPWPTTRHYCGL